MSQDDSPQAACQETGTGSLELRRKPARRRRLVPPIWIWIVVVLAGAAITVVRSTELLRDHGVVNVLTLIAAFVAVVVLLVWFFFRSGYWRWLRMSALMVGVVTVATLAAVLRIERVSGELVPVFAWRFSPKPDRLLEKPGTDLALSGPIDLRTTTPDDFPQFLGLRRDMAVEHVPLARDWAARPPELLWRQPIGAGWGGFAVVHGYAVSMEQRGELEMVTCYEVASGRLRWVHAIPTRFEATMAGVGPRATPTIDDGMVYTLGATGWLCCLDGATGQPAWQKDLLKEYGVTGPVEKTDVPYGRASSPLVVGTLVIVPAGGPKDGPCVSLAAYDKKTGDPVWQGGSRQIAYASPALATLGGIEQILIVNQDYAGGYDLQTGKVLWEHPWPGRSATNASASQAVAVLPDRVFLSKGYGHGASLLELLPNADGTFRTRELWHDARVMRTKFANVTIRDGHVYGLSDGVLECIELATGRRAWKQGRYGHGQILRVQDLLLVLSESGELLLIEASPERPNQVVGRVQALEGITWNNLALGGRYLLVRNAQEAACYRLPLVPTIH